jgi:hypothetical protein
MFMRAKEPQMDRRQPVRHYQSAAEGLAEGFGFRVDVELVVHSPDMAPHDNQADHEAFGRGLIAAAIRQRFTR